MRSKFISISPSSATKQHAESVKRMDSLTSFTDSPSVSLIEAINSETSVFLDFFSPFLSLAPLSLASSMFSSSAEPLVTELNFLSS